MSVRYVELIFERKVDVYSGLFYNETLLYLNDDYNFLCFEMRYTSIVGCVR